MKKLMIGLLSLVAATAMATTIVVQQTDEVIGYDGDCQVYFRPDLGFFEVCPDIEPIILGVTFDTIHFRHGFHFREGFTRERVHSMTTNVNQNTNVNSNINRNTNVNRDVNRNVDVNTRQSREVNRNVNRNQNLNSNVNVNRNEARSVNTPGPLKHEAEPRQRTETRARPEQKAEHSKSRPGEQY